MIESSPHGKLQVNPVVPVDDGIISNVWSKYGAKGAVYYRGVEVNFTVLVEVLVTASDLKSPRRGVRFSWKVFIPGTMRADPMRVDGA